MAVGLLTCVGVLSKKLSELQGGQKVLLLGLASDAQGLHGSGVLTSLR